MEEAYERTLRELREWLEGWIIGAQPIGAAAIISTQESMREIIARAYDVPMEWVNLTDIHFNADRTNIVCEGFTITPGGLDYML
jgi:hypothetical protein